MGAEKASPLRGNIQTENFEELLAQYDGKPEVQKLLKQACEALNALPDRPRAAYADKVLKPLIDAEMAALGKIEADESKTWLPRTVILASMLEKYSGRDLHHARQRWSVLTGVIPRAKSSATADAGSQSAGNNEDNSENGSGDDASAHEIVHDSPPVRALKKGALSVLVNMQPGIHSEVYLMSKPVALAQARATINEWKDRRVIPTEMQIGLLFGSMHLAKAPPHHIKEITQKIKAKWKQFDQRHLDNFAAACGAVVNPAAYQKPKIIHPVVNEWDFEDQWKHGEAKLLEANGKEPRLFVFEDDFCAVQHGKRVLLGERQFEAELNETTTWVRTSAMGEQVIQRGVAAPSEVTRHLYYRSEKPFPELAGVQTTPYFAPSGRLVASDGYDPETKTVLELGGLDVPGVSPQPSDQEIMEAKTLLAECFSDFPVGGLERDAVTACMVSGDMEGCADVANLTAMTLQPFVRDMIDGPTPLYILTKPAPGSGATLLEGVVSTIAEGEPTAPMKMPGTEDEMDKQIASLVHEGARRVFWDNLSTGIDSGIAASALTAMNWKARLLHSNRLVNAPIRFIWVSSANNVEGSGEILRRSVMIELDRKTANPARYVPAGGWKHADIQKWVRQNRGRLVWACLTLIQHWIANGKNVWDGESLPSFEAWSQVMGGILRDAGIHGFLENYRKLTSYAATSGDSSVQMLMDYLAENFDNGTVFRAAGNASIRGVSGTPISIRDQLEDCGDDGGILAINGWGWTRDVEGKVRYGNASGIKEGFRKAARIPWECGEWELTFEEKPDPQSSKQFYWVMTKKKREQDDSVKV